MSVRISTIVLALATIAAPAAFAQSAAFVGGERGWIDQPVRSSLTRQQVTNEYLAFRTDPAAPDGGQFVGGEMGYAFPAHTYARVNGQWVCTDKIAHNAAPAPEKSGAEQRAFQAQYPA